MAKASRVSEIVRRVRARDEERPLSELDLRPPSVIVGGPIRNEPYGKRGHRRVWTTGEARG